MDGLGAAAENGVQSAEPYLAQATRVGFRRDRKKGSEHRSPIPNAGASSNSTADSKLTRIIENRYYSGP